MLAGYRQEHTNHANYSEEQIRRVLESCGINIENEVDSDYIIYCPYHSNYRTPAAEVSKRHGHLYCFGCQESKNLVELVMFASKRSFFEATRLIDSKRTSTNIVDDVNKILQSNKEEYTEFDKTLIESLHRNAMNSRRAINYFDSRGITIESIEKFSLGYSEKKDMVTVPIQSPNGVWVGFVGRSIEGKEFKNSTGLPRNKTMFNIAKAKRFDKVFVVESSFDAIRIEQIGGHAVATLGATINKFQRDLLKKYFASIILISDNDEAGKGMAEKLKGYLGHSLIIGQLPSDVKDVSDMDDGRLSQFVSQFDNEIHYILQ